MTTPRPRTKVSKASVRYRPADLPDVRCGTCVMFHAGTCDLVAGSIDAGHVCDRWQPRRPVPSGHARENTAATAGAAIAAIYAAAELAILGAITAQVFKVTGGALLANLAARRLRQAVTLILHEAEAAARQVLADAAKSIRTDAERVIREELAAISPSLTGRAAAEALGRQAPAAWRGLPLLLHNAGLNVLREADGIYRQVIAADMTSGDPLRAAQQALDEFAERGITAFTDAAGRDWDITSYVQMATRTAASRMHLALQLGAMGAAGHDLVTIVHSGDSPPCPRCAPYIGQVLSVSGMTPTGSEVTVTDADGVEHTAVVMASLAEATAAGLLHPACRCSAVSFADGVSFVPPPPPPHAAQRYEAEQERRAHERALRRQRRLAAVGGKRRRRLAGRPR